MRVEHRAEIDRGLQPQPSTHRPPNALGIDDREHPRHRRIDQRDMIVRLAPELGGSAGEPSLALEVTRARISSPITTSQITEAAPRISFFGSAGQTCMVMGRACSRGASIGWVCLLPKPVLEGNRPALRSRPVSRRHQRTTAPARRPHPTYRNQRVGTRLGAVIRAAAIAQQPQRPVADQLGRRRPGRALAACGRTGYARPRSTSPRSNIAQWRPGCS